MDILEQTKKKMNAALEHLKTELKALRTGRANPAILDHVMVEVYGTMMRLRDMATISVPEARQLLIAPFDNKNVHAISQAIQAANLNVMPIVDGHVVRIKIPEMDAAVRDKMCKQAKVKCEECKVTIRGVRGDSNKEIKNQKDTPEDLRKKLEKQVQDETDKACTQADKLTAEKEKEIQTI